jgi:ATP-binding cassette subfamily F protein 3
VNQAKGRRTRLNRMARLEKPLELKAMSLRLNSNARSGNLVLETDGLEIGIHRFATSNQAPLHLFQCPNLQLWRLERAALIGPNGTGKSTFLKTLLGDLPPLDGIVHMGAGLKIGYFEQAHETLLLENTPLDELMNAKPGLTLQEARNMLGQFLFSGDDIFKKIEVLSGGERGRVALAKLALQGANFLLLDEPTNHLDIPSQEILTEALNRFDGTLLLVSHDRYLISAIATQIWALERDNGNGGNGTVKMTVFKSGYDEWRESQSAQMVAVTPPLEKKPSPPTQTPPIATHTISKNKERERIQRLEAIEQKISAFEHKLTMLGAEMELAGSDFAKVQKLGAEYQLTEQALASAWAEFETEG